MYSSMSTRTRTLTPVHGTLIIYAQSGQTVKPTNMQYIYKKYLHSVLLLNADVSRYLRLMIFALWSDGPKSDNDLQRSVQKQD